MNKLVETITHWIPEGGKVRVQLLHANNLEATEILRQRLDQMFQCVIPAHDHGRPVLGAHTGGGMVGMAFGPADLWDQIP